VVWIFTNYKLVSKLVFEVVKIDYLGHVKPKLAIFKNVTLINIAANYTRFFHNLFFNPQKTYFKMFEIPNFYLKFD
jgi:hypothetical protein